MKRRISNGKLFVSCGHLSEKSVTVFHLYSTSSLTILLPIKIRDKLIKILIQLIYFSCFTGLEGECKRTGRFLSYHFSKWIFFLDDVRILVFFSQFLATFTQIDIDAVSDSLGLETHIFSHSFIHIRSLWTDLIVGVQSLSLTLSSPKQNCRPPVSSAVSNSTSPCLRLTKCSLLELISLRGSGKFESIPCSGHLLIKFDFLQMPITILQYFCWYGCIVSSLSSNKLIANQGVQ